MNETTNSAYTFGTASFEIILLLIGCFALGALLCYVLKKMGLCCKKSVKPTLVVEDQAESEPLDPVAQMRARIGTSSPTASYPPPVSAQMPRMEQETTYEADLRSLLKGRSSDNETISTNSNSSNNTRSTAFPSRITPSMPPKATQVVEPTVAPIVIPDEDHVDDLKKLEGIGSKIEKLLNEAGIKSYAKLATMDRDALKAILDAGGGQFKLHEPKSWPYQAELAAKQNWQRLKEYQDFLISGRNT
ncbi:hypothetical protein [uncultured Thiothrix sp.]|uniref:helix-hairpin-helix domain-containing protein n=1 Tax=uncultured Thiothrix sp. TaxID=223185 RepID=UPI002636CAE6|nr:hypothetical protein [uncultured Thiothrix sp.]